MRLIPLARLHIGGREAVAQVSDTLGQAGLRVVTSFDSRLTSDPAVWVCPHHGAAGCDCQVAMLLVYDSGEQSASLLVSRHDDLTWLYLAVAPGLHPGQSLERRIEEALGVLV